jgi:hypothetical protein
LKKDVFVNVSDQLVNTIINDTNVFSPFDLVKIKGKWYLDSIKDSRKAMKNYNYYFIIINEFKIIFYGGCNVLYSNFQVVKYNSIVGISPS